jgi:hypothetical protein
MLKKNKAMMAVAFAAALGMVAAGCQREDNEGRQTVDTMVDTTTDTTANMAVAYTVQYSVDGVAYTAVVHSDEEYDALMEQLLALVRDGAVVEMWGEGYRPGVTLSNRTVRHTSSNSSDMVSWSKRKAKEGYRVTFTYDTKSKKYVCTARR